MGEHHCTESQDNRRAGTAIGSHGSRPAPLHPARPTLDLLSIHIPVTGPEQPRQQRPEGLQHLQMAFAVCYISSQAHPGQQTVGTASQPPQQLHVLQGRSGNAQLSVVKAGGHHIGFPAVSPGLSWSPMVVMLSPEVQSSPVKPGCSCSSKEKSRQQGVWVFFFFFFPDLTC